MGILIIAEHDNRELKAATLNTITAAQKIGNEIDVLVAGANCSEVVKQAAALEGVSKVKVAEAAHYEFQTAENIAALVVAIALEYEYFLAPASGFGKSVMPRVAAMLDVEQISEIISVKGPDTFVRPIYAGNALTAVKTADKKKVITVRTSAFQAAKVGGSAGVECIALGPDLSLARVVGRELAKSTRPELGSASIIVSGGRGLGSAENYRSLLEPLADRLGAALGASRAAVDAGFVPNDHQIGQTGKVVAPQLYIAVGISGAIQHLAGMKDAKTIVAINNDPEAPIFQVADYGLVCDLFEAVPQLVDALPANHS